MKDYNFLEFIASTHKQIPSINLLPINHTCEGANFIKIIHSEQLQTSHCNVFGEDLLYFFYGKQSYRTNKKNTATGFAHLYPVCLVLELIACGQPYRVIALDSGAFKNNLFDGYLTSTDIKDYVLNSEPDCIRKMVETFYGTNINYLKENIKNDLFAELYPTVAEYINLVRSKHHTNFDSRKSTIELQYNHHIDLQNVKVLFSVFPSVFMDDETVQAQITKWGAPYETYWIETGNPNEFKGFIGESLRRFFQSERFV